MQNTTVSFIFRFDPIKGQYKVKLGQICKIKMILQKHAYLIQFCPRIPKNIISSYVWQLEMPKIAIQKVKASPVGTSFFAIAQPKIKILLWNFVCVSFLFSFTTCRSFLDNSKILDFVGIDKKNQKSKFLLVGIKIETKT